MQLTYMLAQSRRQATLPDHRPGLAHAASANAWGSTSSMTFWLRHALFSRQSLRKIDPRLSGHEYFLARCGMRADRAQWICERHHVGGGLWPLGLIVVHGRVNGVRGDVDIGLQVPNHEHSVVCRCLRNVCQRNGREKRVPDTVATYRELSSDWPPQYVMSFTLPWWPLRPPPNEKTSSIVLCDFERR